MANVNLAPGADPELRQTPERTHNLERGVGAKGQQVYIDEIAVAQALVNSLRKHHSYDKATIARDQAKLAKAEAVLEKLLHPDEKDQQVHTELMQAAAGANLAPVEPASQELASTTQPQEVAVTPAETTTGTSAEASADTPADGISVEELRRRKAEAIDVDYREVPEETETAAAEVIELPGEQAEVKRVSGRDAALAISQLEQQIRELGQEGRVMEMQEAQAELESLRQDQQAAEQPNKSAFAETAAAAAELSDNRTNGGKSDGEAFAQTKEAIAAVYPKQAANGTLEDLNPTAQALPNGAADNPVATKQGAAAETQTAEKSVPLGDWTQWLNDEEKTQLQTVRMTMEASNTTYAKDRARAEQLRALIAQGGSEAELERLNAELDKVQHRISAFENGPGNNWGLGGLYEKAIARWKEAGGKPEEKKKKASTDEEYSAESIARGAIDRDNIMRLSGLITEGENLLGVYERRLKELDPNSESYATFEKALKDQQARVERWRKEQTEANNGEPVTAEMLSEYEREAAQEASRNAVAEKPERKKLIDRILEPLKSRAGFRKFVRRLAVGGLATLMALGLASNTAKAMDNAPEDTSEPVTMNADGFNLKAMADSMGIGAPAWAAIGDVELPATPAPEATTVNLTEQQQANQEQSDRYDKTINFDFIERTEYYEAWNGMRTNYNNWDNKDAKSSPVAFEESWDDIWESGDVNALITRDYEQAHDMWEPGAATFVYCPNILKAVGDKFGVDLLQFQNDGEGLDKFVSNSELGGQIQTACNEMYADILQSKNMAIEFITESGEFETNYVLCQQGEADQLTPQNMVLRYQTKNYQNDKRFRFTYTDVDPDTGEIRGVYTWTKRSGCGGQVVGKKAVDETGTPTGAIYIPVGDVETPTETEIPVDVTEDPFEVEDDEDQIPEDEPQLPEEIEETEEGEPQLPEDETPTIVPPHVDEEVPPVVPPVIPVAPVIPDVTPDPEPEPQPQPDPQPDPEPEPGPGTPTPKPEPEPELIPDPVPDPTPVTPTPQPQPEPIPVPGPVVPPEEPSETPTEKPKDGADQEQVVEDVGKQEADVAETDDVHNTGVPETPAPNTPSSVGGVGGDYTEPGDYTEVVEETTMPDPDATEEEQEENHEQQEAANDNEILPDSTGNNANMDSDQYEDYIESILAAGRDGYQP